MNLEEKEFHQRLPHSRRKKKEDGHGYKEKHSARKSVVDSENGEPLLRPVVKEREMSLIPKIGNIVSHTRVSAEVKNFTCYRLLR